MNMMVGESVSEECVMITAVAIDKDKNSHYAVKWAVENLLNKSPHCVLIHVRTQSLHPQDFEAVPKEGRPPTHEELQQFFLPYRGFCARKGIEAKEVVLHDIDVPSALIDYITSNPINNIVVGASNHSALTRKFRNADVPYSLVKSAPEFCSVYVISKGKVQKTRSASQPQTPRSAISTPTSATSNPRQTSLRDLLPTFPHDTLDTEDMNSQGSWRSVGSDRSSDSFQASPHIKPQSSSRMTSPTLSIASHTSGDSYQKNSLSDASDLSGPPSFLSTDMSYENLDFSMTSENSRSSFSSNTPMSLEAEMKRLKLELKQTMEMYNSACKEAMTAKQRTRELHQWRNEGQSKLQEAKLAEEAAVALVDMEKQKTKAATEAAKVAQRLAEIEIQKRKNVETKAKREADERKRETGALAKIDLRYRKYTIEEVEVATDYCNSSLKIGEGGYGPVFRGVLDHTPVAIKVLKPDVSQGLKQFQQEVEILSCMRHPNMVLLLGACPEYGCLVYEYMENGSLEDRLFQKNDTPPIPWRTRFKIAVEISTSLLFLHQTKPEPLVHRDLKPANILLDRNYVGKISDVGLARLVPASLADSVTQYHMTAAAGTFCYIDPEYQQTGMLGVKSDVYSLGVVLLQMITAKHPMGLSHQIEEAIEKGIFHEMLDPSVPDWPVEEALSMAKLALKCCELRKRDRPDLGSVVLPELKRLRKLALDNGTRDTERIVPRPYTSVPQMEAHERQEGMTNNPNVEMEIQRRSM